MLKPARARGASRPRRRSSTPSTRPEAAGARGDLQLLAAHRAARAGADLGRALGRRRAPLRRRPAAARRTRRTRSSRCCASCRGPRTSRPSRPRGCRCCACASTGEAIARYGINADDVLDGGRDWSAASPWARCSRGSGASPCRCASTRGARRPRAHPRPAGGSARRATAGRRGSPARRSSPTITVEEGPAQISRDRISRRINVEANVRGRDLGSFVAEAQAGHRPAGRAAAGLDHGVGRAVREPAAGDGAARGAGPAGAAPDLRAALHHLRLGAPRRADLPERALRDHRRPLGLGPARLSVLDLGRRWASSRCSASRCSTAWCWSRTSSSCSTAGMAPEAAAVAGARIRLRPVLMTALVAALGFVPMALATQRRRRGAAAARDGRHRRAGDLDAADAARAAGGLQLVRPEVARSTREHNAAVNDVGQRRDVGRDAALVLDAHERLDTPAMVRVASMTRR